MPRHLEELTGHNFGEYLMIEGHYSVGFENMRFVESVGRFDKACDDSQILPEEDKDQKTVHS